MLDEEVVSLCLKTVTQRVTARGSCFIHLEARTENSSDACLHCTLRNSGSNQAVWEDQQEQGAEQSVISDLRELGTGPFLACRQASVVYTWCGQLQEVNGECEASGWCRRTLRGLKLHSGIVVQVRWCIWAWNQFQKLVLVVQSQNEEGLNKHLWIEMAGSY